MKIHFSASLQHLDEHLESYNLISEVVRSNGHELLKDWLKDYQHPGKSTQVYTDKEWEDITTQTLEAILKADAVIIEASTTSFSMGYQAALALAHKKPLLILFDSRYQHFILDSSNSLKRAEVYHNQDELERAVTSFLRDNDIDSKSLRFNMVLDREVYNFLHWESVNTGRTKAQIVRDVIREQIRKNIK